MTAPVSIRRCILEMSCEGWVANDMPKTVLRSTASPRSSLLPGQIGRECGSIGQTHRADCPPIDHIEWSPISEHERECVTGLLVTGLLVTGLLVTGLLPSRPPRQPRGS